MRCGDAAVCHHRLSSNSHLRSPLRHEPGRCWNRDMKRDLTIARTWLRIQKDWWEWDELNEACRQRPNRAWRIILGITRLANSRDLVRDLGCGPLEDLIAYHAPTFINRIERECDNNPRLRRAMSSVWLPEATDAVSRRLLALGCHPLKVKLNSWQSKKPKADRSTKRTKLKWLARPDP